MKFKEIRDLIYTECRVLVDRDMYVVQTHEPTIFDDMEIVGIRSRDIMLNGYCAGSYVEVLLK